MTARVIKNLFLLFSIVFFISCVSKKIVNSAITEIHDNADSSKSLQRLKLIKNLEYSVFNEAKFSDGKISVKYRLLSPETNDLDIKYPLILVFHGSGAIGNDNSSQMGVLSKMWLLPENRKKYPAYILSPQFPFRSSNYYMDSSRNVQVSKSNDHLDLVLNSIKDIIKEKNIDPDRIYVIGFSMGGATVSNAISKTPDLFAAAINISGISQFDKIQELKNLPILIVHGELDTDNLPESNIKFQEEMRLINGKVIFWNYKDKFHNNILSSELVEAIPQWLFKQKK